MSIASHASTGRTALRLRARRLVVVDDDAARAQAFARALEESGAAAAAVTPMDADHAAVHALDADVLLVNEDAPEACRPLVLALRQHPRTRWATVLPLSFTALWPDGAAQPDTAAIADEVSRLAETLVEFTVRAKGRLPYATQLEPLGPSRMLRVLGSTGRSLRVSFSDDRLEAELQLGDGRLGGVRAGIDRGERTLADAAALVEILALASGQVRIEDREDGPLSGWKASVPAALETAAALAWPPVSAAAPRAAKESGVRAVERHVLEAELAPPGEAPPASSHLQPTVPQISVADVLADAAAMGIGPEGGAADALADAEVAGGGGLPGGGSEEGASRAEPASSVAHDDASEPQAGASAIEPAPEGLRTRTPRRLARSASISFAVFALLALGFSLYTRSPQRGAPAPAKRARPAVAAQAAASPAPANAMPAAAAPRASASASAAEAAPSSNVDGTATAAAAAAEPSSAAQQPAEAEAAVATREPTRSELARAKRIAKRGHRYLRLARYGRATTAYENAVALAPAYAPAIAGLVRVHLHRRNAGEAVRWAERLAALEPDSGVSQLLLGDAYALSGDVERAALAWRRARELGSAAARDRLRKR